MAIKVKLKIKADGKDAQKLAPKLLKMHKPSKETK
jgi:hypothetical protein